MRFLRTLKNYLSGFVKFISGDSMILKSKISFLNIRKNLCANVSFKRNSTSEENNTEIHQDLKKKIK